MPIQTRCPSCSAAIPTNAAWCSLCHSDLRPRSAPRPTAPAAPTTIIVAPVPGTVLEDTRVGADSTDDELEDELAPVGRHSREAPVDSTAPATRTAPTARPSRALPSRGKHAGSGRRSAPPARSGAVLDVADLTLAVPGDATPEQVDEIADQMLTHLALVEPQPQLFDPDDFPGGRWGFAGAGLIATIVILLVIYTILGFVLG